MKADAKPARIMFFSRGRGYGHAVPDIAIYQELKLLAPQLNVTFASYATGATVLSKAGVPLINLALPESPTFVAALHEVFPVISETQPDVVIAHEEFAAVAAASLLNTPSIFISAWIPKVGSVYAEAVSCASAILVLEESGIFPLPAELRATPVFAGPLLRNMQFTRMDRRKLRDGLGISQSAVCLVVVPGGATGDTDYPVADTVVSMFRRIEASEKAMFWISSKDYDVLSARYAETPGVSCLKYSDPIERYLSIADIVLTRGTRGITWDAAAVGVPSISLSPGRNPIDDLLVPRVKNNLALSSSAVTADVLLEHVRRMLSQAGNVAAPRLPATATPRSCAEHLIKQVYQLL